MKNLALLLALWLSLSPLAVMVSLEAQAATTTANMSLLVPSVGDTDYPTSFSTTFGLVDLHDHSSGKGVQIPAGGLATSSVTSAKILDGTIVAADIADSTITNAKRAAAGELYSSGSGTTGTQATSAADFASRTFTATGRPVFVGVQGQNASSARMFFSYVSGSRYFNVRIVRDATVIALYRMNTGTASLESALSMFKVETPAAGAYTYKLQGWVEDAANTLFLDNLELVVHEF